jgi:hypothetical protein
LATAVEIPKESLAEFIYANSYTDACFVYASECWTLPEEHVRRVAGYKMSDRKRDEVTREK